MAPPYPRWILERYELPPLDPQTERGLDFIGSIVREARRRTGLTQQALGDIVGLSQSTISRLENGRLRSLRFIRFADIVEVLHPALRAMYMASLGNED